VRFPPFFLTISRRRARPQRSDQPLGDGSDFFDRCLKRRFVDARRPGGAAQFPDKLKRRRADFVIGGRRFEIRQSLDVPAHAIINGPMNRLPDSPIS